VEGRLPDPERAALLLVRSDLLRVLADSGVYF